jgi:hypothetical protein
MEDRGCGWRCNRFTSAGRFSALRAENDRQKKKSTALPQAQHATCVSPNKEEKYRSAEG